MRLGRLHEILPRRVARDCLDLEALLLALAERPLQQLDPPDAAGRALLQDQGPGARALLPASGPGALTAYAFPPPAHAGHPLPARSLGDRAEARHAATMPSAQASMLYLLTSWRLRAPNVWRSFGSPASTFIAQARSWVSR